MTRHFTSICIINMFFQSIYTLKNHFFFSSKFQLSTIQILILYWSSLLVKEETFALIPISHKIIFHINFYFYFNQVPLVDITHKHKTASFWIILNWIFISEIKFRLSLENLSVWFLISTKIHNKWEKAFNKIIKEKMWVGWEFKSES
jgi:hypothetical protein